MNGETTTGPLFFGRWSQPAALVNAGLVPPDLFPLEKILFCARCGQQFIGTHRTGTGIEDSSNLTDTHSTAGAHQPSGTPVNGGVRVTGTHLTSTREADGPHQPGCTCSPDSTHATGGALFCGS